ncbi:MAG: pyruvate dehydrogenase (acetyl-transferring) E1 component subunit alpha [Phototrophicaceae bacterium]
MDKPNKEMLLDWYRQMTLIREFEETCYQLYFDKRITGVYLHLYSGHEAVAVGAMANMEMGKDHIITAYRDHAQALILGVDPNLIMAEMMGKKTGLSGGKGGSMHLASAQHNFWGGYAIVGGHLPLAAGIGLAAQYNETGAVVLSHIGDGATNNGYFHEALNFAGLWDLPVVWLIENNGYGMGTEIERSAGNPVLHERAIGYGVKDFGRVDGQDVFAMYDTLSKAYEHCRNGGSALVEAITYRYRGHGVSDKQYDGRLADELAEWKENKDPIEILKRHLLDIYKSVKETDLDAIEEKNRDIVAESVEFAENSDFPTTLDDLYANVYVD